MATTNPFQRHGIEHLSPSSLNCYAEQPSFWCLKYLHGFKDDGSPAAWRGSAVEAGLDHWLFKRDKDVSLVAALDRFELDALGLCDDGTERERTAIAAFLDRAMLATGELGPPTVRQFEVNYWFEGVEVPILGRIDYEWEQEGIDLKTTNRMPSLIPGRHARQISLYQAARGKPYKILYVTPSKFEFKELSNEESQKALKTLEWHAHAIRRVLSMFSCKYELSKIFAPDWDHYFWKREEARQAAAEIWK